MQASTINSEFYAQILYRNKKKTNRLLLFILFIALVHWSDN